MPPRGRPVARRPVARRPVARRPVARRSVARRWRPRLRAELSRQRPSGLTDQVTGIGVAGSGDHHPDRAHDITPRVEDRAGQPRPRRSRPRPARGRPRYDGSRRAGARRSSGDVSVSPVMLRSGAAGQHAVGVLRAEGQHRLAQRARVGRDHDPDLGHLSASVGSRLVLDDHHVVDQQDPGPDRHARYGERGPRPTGSPWIAARGCRGRRCPAAAPPARAGSGWIRAPARPCRARPGSVRSRASWTAPGRAASPAPTGSSAWPPAGR